MMNRHDESRGVRRFAVRGVLGTLAAAVVAVAGVGAAERAAAELVDVGPDHAQEMAAGLKLFRETVRPVLLASCVDCHGGDRVRADLDLVTRTGLLTGGESGPSIVPGDAANSYLYQVVTHDRQPHMPRQGDKLDEESLEHIRRWIELGAPYDKPLIDDPNRAQRGGPMQITESDRNWWAFRELGDHVPPAVEHPDWPRTDIDRFLLADMEQAGIKPNDRADRRRLVRRAYLGVTGLPPTPEQVATFVNDESPEAWERVVDDVLSSPHYGERWARHWLDIARFAESHGFEQDYDRPYAYHYRDFVIQALNQDMPYDQFVRWQLAGDEIAPDNPLAMMATGFLGAGVFPTQLTEREFKPARYDEMDDMLATTGVAMLGVTIGCARCHDHKYDPIPEKDYYRMLSLFTKTIRSNIELELDKEQAHSGQRPQPEMIKVMVTSEGFDPIPHHADGRGFPHYYEQTYQLSRGDLNQKQGVAQPGFLQVLSRQGAEAWLREPPEGSRTSHRRYALADWITDVEYGAGHLLARVIVNRLWQHHLGRGIVATPNDFGLQGTPPTHPELLDYLASELIRNGWRLKPIHRKIMTSAVYQLDDAPRTPAMQIDPDNELFWRWNRRRLEAEPIRDAMLAVAGQLDARMFGSGHTDQGHQRRAIYFFIKRSDLPPFLTIFDKPEPLTSVAVRATTTVAPQGLLMMNNRHVRQAAEGFANRVRPELAESTEAAVSRAYALAFNRAPTESEQARAVAFLAEQASEYERLGQADESLADFCQLLLASNEFVYLD